MMKPLLITLATALAASLAWAPSARAQDADAGARKASMCIGCHNIAGYQATFPEIYKVPKIAGQNAKYLISALTAYRKGERKHPSMRSIAATLTDQDMADLAAWYERLGKGQAAPADPGPPPARLAALLTKANCESCHGKNFSTPIDASYPKLGGQYEDYLYIALKAYQTDKNPYIGRSNPIMMGMAKPFTHAELKALAAYMASLPGELKRLDEGYFVNSPH